MELQSLITTRDLTEEQIRHLISFAQIIKKSPEKFTSTLKGKTVLQFFVENSTRTKTSFEAATRKLGGVNVAFAPGASSLSKGESLVDTANTLKQYGADLIVIRHPSSGSPQLVREVTGLPVVNGGDGTHEHPSQALLDAFTLIEAWGGNIESARGKKILIIGDIFHSRVAKSNIHFLSKLGAHVILCAPHTFLPNDMSLFPKIEIIHRLDDARGVSMLQSVDAVMGLRIQFERQNAKMNIPSKEEFRHFWGLTVERAATMKKGAFVLHPGPMNRGLEIDPEVADSDASLVLKQVENGVWARMALLATLLAPEVAKGARG